MSRLAAYLGPPLRLDRFLLGPDAGLPAQARNPGDGLPATAASFGVGWYAHDEAPARYARRRAIYADPNLPHLARSLHGGIWLAMTSDHADPASLQPLCDRDLLFAHTGAPNELAHIQRPLREFLDPDIEATMTGNGGADYLFALLRHLLADDIDIGIDEALIDMLELVGDWLGEGPAGLTLTLTEGERLYSVRHAWRQPCPPLHYCVDDEAFPDAQLLATSPLTDSGLWQPVPEHHLLILDPEGPPELIEL